tara:strand:- start:673 stop:972 length:300 start_codon:yes stop_codon:yes gene_type:complete
MNHYICKIKEAWHLKKDNYLGWITSNYFISFVKLLYSSLGLANKPHFHTSNTSSSIRNVVLACLSSFDKSLARPDYSRSAKWLGGYASKSAGNVGIGTN